MECEFHFVNTFYFYLSPNDVKFHCFFCWYVEIDPRKSQIKRFASPKIVTIQNSTASDSILTWFYTLYFSNTAPNSVKFHSVFCRQLEVVICKAGKYFYFAQQVYQRSLVLSLLTWDIEVGMWLPWKEEVGIKGQVDLCFSISAEWVHRKFSSFLWFPSKPPCWLVCQFYKKILAPKRPSHQASCWQCTTNNNNSFKRQDTCLFQ